MLLISGNDSTATLLPAPAPGTLADGLHEPVVNDAMTVALAAQGGIDQVATRTNAAPQAISNAPVMRPSQWPAGMVFSRSTNTASPTIQ
jgi:hypothetical protein